MLDTYKNIKIEREKRGWSQLELAEKVGYNDRTSIAKIESGSIDLPSSKITAFAKAFNVSEVDLMGFSDDVQTIAAHHDDENWTEEELQEIENFKKYVLSKRKNVK